MPKIIPQSTDDGVMKLNSRKKRDGSFGLALASGTKSNTRSTVSTSMARISGRMTP